MEERIMGKRKKKKKKEEIDNSAQKDKVNKVKTSFLGYLFLPLPL